MRIPIVALVSVFLFFGHASAEPPKPLMPPFITAAAREGQQEWAKYLGREVSVTNSIGADMILIPPGRFRMGSAGDEKGREDDEDQIAVTITKPFSLSRTEVTQAQWRRVMGTAPWSGKKYVRIGADYPANYVNWDDAKAFCRKLSEMEGVEYRLPTEAEWEWACRAGTVSRYFYGDGDGELVNYAWFGRKISTEKNAQFTHPVGQKLANPFGLVDLYGNLLEWTQDAYEKQFNGGDDLSATDPTGPPTGTIKVLRGGSWYSQNPEYCRSANRFWTDQKKRDHDGGFRLARTEKVAAEE